MKDFNELTLKGMKQRLNKVYGLLDPETTNKIYNEYDYMEDYPERIDTSFCVNLAKLVFEENEKAGNFNTRKYSNEIYNLLKGY